VLVRMLVKIGGTRDGAEWPNVGGTIDLPEPEAASLVANRYARHAEEVPVAGPADEQDAPDPDAADQPAGPPADQAPPATRRKRAR